MPKKRNVLPDGVTLRHTILLVATVLAAGGIPWSGANAQTSAGDPAPRAERSPWQGIIDGNGRVIPCRCRYDGRQYAIGETVCMSTYQGVVLTRCDLVLNNTSWIPTDTPCRPTSELMRPPVPSTEFAARAPQAAHQ